MATIKYYRAINFDLYKTKLDRKFGNAAIKYRKIENFMSNNDFAHRQGSGYLSNMKLSNVEFWDVMDNLYEEQKWLKIYAKDIILTNVIGEFDIKQRYSIESNIESMANLEFSNETGKQ